MIWEAVRSSNDKGKLNFKCETNIRHVSIVMYIDSVLQLYVTFLDFEQKKSLRPFYDFECTTVDNFCGP